jgi:RNA polymerase sigma-70 factor (ECF subfamily)
MTGTLEDESADESALVASLCAGDESAFAQLVDRYTPTMLRVARGYVRSHETAEEVVQETWIALIKGISKFEGRSSLRTWLFTVMINIAKARGVRERRNFDAEVAAFTGGTVDTALFRGPGEEWAGDWKNWEEYPRAFPASPEGSALARELVAVTQAELERLPDGQRMVVTLRDMLGFDSAEVCQLLDISAVNQRVLLHRGRAAIRTVLESYLGVGP